jgi:uncharacterized protein (TIGR02266 family)
MADQRRKQRRFPLELEIALHGQAQFWVGTTKDIAEGGVFIASRELRPIGAELELTINLPEPFKPVVAVGSVRWIRDTSQEDAPLGMGVQFTTVSDESLQTIRRFLARTPPLQA